VRHVHSSWGGVSLWPLVEGGGCAPCSRFVGCGGPSSLLVGGGGCGSSSPVAGGGDEPLSLLMGFAAWWAVYVVVVVRRRFRRRPSSHALPLHTGFIVPRRLRCPSSSLLSPIIFVVPRSRVVLSSFI
jgi:hypothetical protein